MADAAELKITLVDETPPAATEPARPEPTTVPWQQQIKQIREAGERPERSVDKFQEQFRKANETSDLKQLLQDDDAKLSLAQEGAGEGKGLGQMLGRFLARATGLQGLQRLAGAGTAGAAGGAGASMAEAGIAAGGAGGAGGAGAGGALAGVATALGPVGLAVAGVGIAVGVLYKSIDAAVTSFVERGKELAGYSAELTGAGARANVRGTMADIREAQELGPAIARLTDAQSRVSAEWREFWLPVKEFLANQLANFLEVVATLMEGFNDAMTVQKVILEAIFEVLQNPTKILGLTELPQKIADALEKKRRDIPEDPWAEMFANMEEWRPITSDIMPDPGPIFGGGGAF